MWKQICNNNRSGNNTIAKNIAASEATTELEREGEREPLRINLKSGVILEKAPTIFSIFSF